MRADTKLKTVSGQLCFGADKRGGTVVIFALVLPILLIAVGGALDFAGAQRLKQQLQDAADVASLGVVAANSPTYQSAVAMNGTGNVPGADKVAIGMLKSAMPTQEIGSSEGDKGPKTGAKVTRSNNSVDSSVTISANYKTTFLAMVGIGNIPVNVTSEASANMPSYTDFYLLLDNSPSMGLGATTADIKKLEDNTPNKCAFACHQLDKPDKTGKNVNNYNLAKFLGVQTRIDVVRMATKDMMKTAKESLSIPNQFRMAIYHFGTAADKIDLQKPKAWRVSALSSNLDQAATNAEAIDLMTIPYQNYNSDRQTNFQSVLGDMNTIIPNPGNGSTPAKAHKVLMFVTDGVNDGYDCNYNNGSTCRRITPIDPAYCNALKDRGVRVAVLYTTYLPVPNDKFYRDWVAKYVPNKIAENMKACASPGLYFEVSPSEGIGEAMDNMFRKVIATVRITS